MYRSACMNGSYDRHDTQIGLDPRFISFGADGCVWERNGGYTVLSVRVSGVRFLGVSYIFRLFSFRVRLLCTKHIPSLSQKQCLSVFSCPVTTPAWLDLTNTARQSPFQTPGIPISRPPPNALPHWPSGLWGWQMPREVLTGSLVSGRFEPSCWQPVKPPAGEREGGGGVLAVL